MADTNTLSGLSKEVYEKGISEGVNNSFDLSDEFPIEQVEWQGGLGHVWSHHHKRNISPFFGGEDTAYPVAGNQLHAKGNIKIKKMLARIRMTEEGMEDLVSSDASFRNGMTDEKTRLIDDVSRRENHALGMDGRGALALVDTGSSGTTVELDAPGNIAGDNYGNRFIDVGMFLAFVIPASGTLRNTTIESVTALNSDGSDITMSADPTVTANDYVVHAANTSVTDVNDTSYEKAYWGLPALIDDGTNRDDYFGISRAQVGSLKSYVTASVGALSLDVAQRTADVVYETLGGIIDTMVMHPSVRREYIKLMADDRRYTASNLQKPDAGTVAMKQGDLTLGEVKIRALRSIGLAQVYFYDSKKIGFKRYVAEPGKFMDRDGSVWVRDGSGTSARHAYEATWFARKQFFAKAPAMGARWDGVTGQTLVVVRDL